MTLTIDDLVRLYEVAHYGAANGPRDKTNTRAGIIAIVNAMRDEFERVYHAGIAHRAMRIETPTLRDEYISKVINEILGDAGNEATTDAIQSCEGENTNGLRRSTDGAEGREEGHSGRVERQGHVSVPCAGEPVQSEPSPAARHLPRGYRNQLSPTHRHESGERGHRGLDGSAVGPDCGGLGRHGLNEKAAGGPTREDGRAVQPGSTTPAVTVQDEVHFGISVGKEFAAEPSVGQRLIKAAHEAAAIARGEAEPAAQYFGAFHDHVVGAAAPAVCVWIGQDEGPAHEIWKTRCGTRYERGRSPGWCGRCGLPISFKENER